MVDIDGIPVGFETSNPITDTRLYYLELLAADVEIAFFTAPYREKVWSREVP